MFAVIVFRHGMVISCNEITVNAAWAAFDAEIAKPDTLRVEIVDASTGAVLAKVKHQGQPVSVTPPIKDVSPDNNWRSWPLRRPCQRPERAGEG